ncbi:MAG: sensor domain-containing diguanylate cyclase, partial [Candidatus Omnitrophica bacterium]|nr:sensor domain-containing diguanylate cyclase [Candidatus Omnitrophota bacterium]
MNTFLSRLRNLSLETQIWEEKINKVAYDIAHLEKIKPQLFKKLVRYRDLKNMVELLNKEISLEYVANTLVSLCFETISEKKGAACVYLVDTASNKLKLFMARKENESIVIKAKEGDEFDYWVLRHMQPLLIENLAKDFRFDLEKLKSKTQRPVSSLAATPLVSEKRLLGILRLDSPQPHFFTQEDLSFLSALSDLAAVALENAELYLETRELAIHDSLTGLYTKGYFIERLKEEFQRALRQGLELSVYMLDIDHFKDYNDKYGHAAGDIILKNIAYLMNDFFEGKNSVICRFGGEEFMVLLPCTGQKQAVEWAEGLRKVVENRKFVIRRKDTMVTVSIGVASLFKQVA